MAVYSIRTGVIDEAVRRVASSTCSPLHIAHSNFAMGTFRLDHSGRLMCSFRGEPVGARQAVNGDAE